MANNGQSRTRFLAQHRKKSVSVLTRALYRNVRGITISAEVRKQGEGATCRKCGGDDDKDDAHLTYGEIRVESFDLALSHASNYCSVGLNDKGKCDKQRNVFYDLGSGTGKALFAAAFNLHHPFDACVGLEIMPELSDVASATLDMFKSSVATASEKISANVFHECVAKSGALRAGKAYSEAELREFVSDVAASRKDKCLLAPENEGELANALVKKIGHKSFKVSMKPFKSFHRFIVGIENSGKDDHESASGKVEVGEEDAACPPQPAAEEEPAFDSDGLSKGEALEQLLLQKDVLASLTSPAPAEMRALCQDIFSFPWHQDASIAYCSSLLFGPEMMSRLAIQVTRMQPGAVFMSLKRLPLEEVGEEAQRRVELAFEAYYEMSWHRCRVFFYRILSDHTASEQEREEVEEL